MLELGLLSGSVDGLAQTDDEGVVDRAPNRSQSCRGAAGSTVSSGVALCETQLVTGVPSIARATPRTLVSRDMAQLAPASGVVSTYLTSYTRSVNFQPSGVRW